MSLTSLFARRLLGGVALLLIGGFAGSLMVRLAPGFGADDRDLDPRFSEAAREQFRRERAGEHDILRYYGAYLGRLVRGDWGESRQFGRPVRELIAERAPVTAALAGYGLALGWLAGLAAAVGATALRASWIGGAASVMSSLLLATPAALVAFACLYFEQPVSLCLAGVIFPRVYRYTRDLLRDLQSRPHVLAGRAAGWSRWRLFLRAVAPGAAPQTIALAGVSVSTALGASIPVEALADVAGIGQLAWRAALGRDLALLVTLTLLVTAVTVAANLVSDLALEWNRRAFTKAEAA